MKYKMKWYPFVLFFCLILANCSKFDEYKKYAPDGEKVYLQKADSLKTYPGKNRIRLEWLLVDPKVTSCKVFYDQNGIEEEVVVVIPAFDNRENDTIRALISDLEERTYSFKIVSYDDFGNTSIPVETEEQIYGETYEQSLLNCLVKSTEFDLEKNILTLEWGTVAASVIGVELDYMDTDDILQTIFVDPSKGTTTIPDFKLGEPLLYSTMYKPIPSSIDTFSVDRERIYIELIDNVVLKKPVTSSGSATPAFTGVNAVDGDRKSRWISPGKFLPDPQWLEVDLQGFFEVSGFGMWRDGSNIEGSQKFSFQAWIDNDWIDVFTEDNNVMQVYNREFDSVTTNKIRLYLHPTVSVDYMIRLYEIEVYAVTRY